MLPSFGLHFLPAAIVPVRVLQADRTMGTYVKTGFFQAGTVRNPAVDKNLTVAGRDSKQPGSFRIDARSKLLIWQLTIASQFLPSPLKQPRGFSAGFRMMCQLYFHFYKFFIISLWLDVTAV
jgi:hypothetical protein